MARTLTLAAIQAAYGDDLAANIAKTAASSARRRRAARRWSCPRSCSRGPTSAWRRRSAGLREAHPWREHPCVTALAPLAGELGVVLPISIFEREGPHYFNSLVMADADGSLLGVYRKSHIPDGPGYQEKYYFRPGDTGFRVWETRHGRLGVGVCWDQWFPEAARAMTLMGAEALLYPTAIGSEPHDPTPGHRRALAARHAGARGLQRDPGRRRQPHRLRALARLSRRRPAVLRLAPSSATTAATSSPSLAATRKASSPRPSTSTSSPPPRRLGLLPRPPPRPLRIADGAAAERRAYRSTVRPLRMTVASRAFTRASNETFLPSFQRSTVITSPGNTGAENRTWWLRIASAS